MTLRLLPISNPEKVGGFNTNFSLIQEYINNNLLNREGVVPSSSNQMEVDLDMNGHFLINLGVDVNNSKSVLNVEEADKRYLSLSGGFMGGNLDMANKRLRSVPWPEQAGDAANKSYVDSLLSDGLDLQRIEEDLSNHIEDGNNPHSVTKAQVGLSNVDNTSDLDKPVSTAQQIAIDNAGLPLEDRIKLDSIETGAEVNSVTSVNTKTGDVIVTQEDVGLGNVDNTSDLDKPVSTDTQEALDLKAALASPAFTGAPTAPTPTTGDNTTKVATTAFVQSTVDAVSSGVTSVNGESGSVVLDSGDIAEGTNLYHTDSRSRNAISASGDLSYSPTTGIISFSETYSTDGEIKTAYESNANTNALTDLLLSKLNGIESGAEANTVDSVNNQTGVVTLSKGDVGLGNVPNVDATNATNLASGTVPEARLPASALIGDTTYSAGTGIGLTGTTFRLTGETYTTAEKSKLAAIEAGAEVNTVSPSDITDLETEIATKVASDELNAIIRDRTGIEKTGVNEYTIHGTLTILDS